MRSYANFVPMGKAEEKFHRKRLRLAYISSVTSITLVLFVLGLVGILLVTSKGVQTYVKETIVTQVFFAQTASAEEINRISSEIETMPAVREVRLLDPEMSKAEFIEEFGEDFTGVVENPIYYNLEIRMKADWFQEDSLLAFESSLLQQYGDQIMEIHKDEDLIGMVNRNLETVSFALLIVSVLLALVMISLINNTIRLSIYSKRFLIKTMQLVGATSGFIRRPFIRTAIWQGLLSACIANILLHALLYYLKTVAPEISNIIPAEKILFVSLALVALGLFFTWVFTSLAVRKFLRLKVDALY